MQQKLPNGFVGAEVIIDGECWVVTRPIGMNLPSRASRACLGQLFGLWNENRGPAALRILSRVPTFAFAKSANVKIPLSFSNSAIFGPIPSILVNLSFSDFLGVFAFEELGAVSA